MNDMNFTRYPMLFDLSDKDILFVGGGKVAERKILTILDFSTNITLIAPNITSKIAELERKKQICVIKSNFKEEMITNLYSFVFITTNNTKLNKQIALKCKNLKIPVNIADNPDLSDFHMPAIISDYENEILISISTNGKNPAKSKRIKEKLIKFIQNGGLTNI